MRRPKYVYAFLLRIFCQLIESEDKLQQDQHDNARNPEDSYNQGMKPSRLDGDAEVLADQIDQEQNRKPDYGIDQQLENQFDRG